MSLPPSVTDASTQPPQPPELPRYSWQSLSPDAQLLYVQSVEHANREITLLNTDVVGFDLEWKPVYRRGQPDNPVALIQLANNHKVLLIHICKMPEFPEKLKDLLENPGILKAGAGIQNDAQKLFRDCNVSMQGCVDLALLARTVDNVQWKGPFKQPIGLARLVQTYQSLVMDKGRVQRSNWERQLSLAQQTYAGNDAHAGFIVYTRLEELMKVMTITPETEYYSFDCVRGSLRKPSGALWFPYNPNYDPGPPPPPKNDKKDKEKQPSNTHVHIDARPHVSQFIEVPVAGSSMKEPKSFKEHQPSRPAFRKQRPRPQWPQAQTSNQSLPQFGRHRRPPPQSMTVDRFIREKNEMDRSEFS